jgi:hypothetical protein
MAHAPPPVETLPSSTPETLSIRLNSLELVFRNPSIDPFIGAFDGRSGMEHLECALSAHRSRPVPEVASVQWIVPVEEATEEHRAATRNAIAGYCRAQSAITEHARLQLADERRRAWIMGGLFFIACFSIAASLEAAETLTGLRGLLLLETIVIAGWVGLWHPLDLTLYAWWPLRSRLNLLKRIARLEVMLVPDSGS